MDEERQRERERQEREQREKEKERALRAPWQIGSCFYTLDSLGCPVVPLFPFWGILGSLVNPCKEKRAPF